MCIGLPMQIKETGPGYARCEGMGVTREIDTLLVGDLPKNSWVLVFLNSAREVLTPENAAKITDAVTAVNVVMNNQGKISEEGLENQTIDVLFADLIDREPQKPASLIALEEQQTQNLDKN